MSDKIKYKVEYRKRKSIGIIINDKCEVIVRAPLGVDEENIEKIIVKKKRWIEEKLKMFGERLQLKDDEVMYIGKVYKKKVLEQKFLKRNFVCIQGDNFLVNVVDKSKVDKTLEKWFREKCLEMILNIIEEYKDEFEIDVKEVKVKEQKSKWGCCTYDNRIFFNWHLIMAREDAIKYVVIHEMCHMIHKNHSKDFWQEVERIMPEYKKEDLYLKEKGYMLKL